MNTLFNQMLSALEDVKNGDMAGVGFLQTAIVALDNLNDAVLEHINSMPKDACKYHDDKSDGKFGQMARIVHAFDCDCPDAQKMRESHLQEVNIEMGKHTSDEGIVELLQKAFGEGNVKVFSMSLGDFLNSDTDNIADKIFGKDKPKFN